MIGIKDLPNSILKGLCYAICYLFQAKTCQRINSIFQNKKNDAVLLFKTIFRPGKCFLRSVATDSKDFQVLMLYLQK